MRRWRGCAVDRADRARSRLARCGSTRARDQASAAFRAAEHPRGVGRPRAAFASGRRPALLPRLRLRDDRADPRDQSRQRRRDPDAGARSPAHGARAGADRRRAMTMAHDFERRLAADLRHELDAADRPASDVGRDRRRRHASRTVAAGSGGQAVCSAIAAVLAAAGAVALLGGTAAGLDSGLPDPRRLCRGVGPADARRGDGSRGDLPARGADGVDDDGDPAAGRLGGHRQRRWPGSPDPGAGRPRVRSLAGSALVVPGWIAVSRDSRRTGAARRHRD